jgi:hypothetical protein
MAIISGGYGFKIQNLKKIDLAAHHALATPTMVA